MTLIKKRNKKLLVKGYSLIEASLVIAILSMAAIGALTFSSYNSSNNKVLITQNNINYIESALINFVNQNGYLPCPALHNGTVSGGTFGVASGSCATGTAPSGIYGMLGTNFTAQNLISGGTATKTTNEDIWVGVVPTRTLGISDSYMYDGFGNRITYAIPRVLGIAASGFSKFTTNFQQIIQISDVSNNIVNPPSTPSANPNPIAYVLLSHGANSSGANTFSGGVTTCPTTGTDRNNCGYISSPTFNTFYDTLYNDNSTNYFDDVIRWKTLQMLSSQAKYMVSGAASTSYGPIYAGRFYESSANATFVSGTTSYVNRRLDSFDPDNTLNETNVSGFAFNNTTYTITLPAGTYLFRGFVPIYSNGNVSTAVARIFNTTNSTAAFTSTSYVNWAGGSADQVIMRYLSGVVTISSSTDYRLQAAENNGGSTAGYTGSVVGAILEIYKIG